VNKKRHITKLADDDYEFTNRRNLKICRTCYELHGQIFLTDKQKVEQHCACNPINDEKWTEGPYKLRFDYNRRYETCYCCGLRIIECGSKWSIFYCPSCAFKIGQLNRTIGQCVIPIGRHSIMNGFALSGSDRSKNRDEAIESFLQAHNRTVNLILLADDYRKIILKKQIDRVGLSEDGSVLDLIQLIAELEEINLLQDEAFFGLLGYISGKQVDEAKAFYQDCVRPR
jgi:hypothetical protein